MLLNGLVLIVLGIVAIPKALFPKKYTDFILTYRAYIGIACLIIGFLGIIWSLTRLNMLDEQLLKWVVMLIGFLLEVNLGFMLAYKLKPKKVLLIRNQDPKSVKPDVESFQMTMSLISIGMGFCHVVFALL